MSISRARLLLLSVCGAMLLAGCAHPPAAQFPRPFSFYHDTCAFTNQLLWEYQFPPSGKMVITKSPYKADYFNRCFPMIQAVRKYQYHAVFSKDTPAPEDPAPEIRQIVSRGDYPSQPENLVQIGGFTDLREFTSTHEKTVKAYTGSIVRSYIQRGNWRIGFPFTRWGQAREAARLSPGVPSKFPIIHIVELPRINHGLLIYNTHEDAENIWFHCYDPNDNINPRLIWFDKSERQFYITRTPYFPGGKINVYEVYRNLLY